MQRPPKIDNADIALEHGKRIANEIMDRATKGNPDEVASFAVGVLTALVGHVLGTVAYAAPDQDEAVMRLLKVHLNGVSKMTRLKVMELNQTDGGKIVPEKY